METMTIETHFISDGQKQTKLTTGISIAYDGCHKIYICQDEIDRKNLLSYGYEEHPIEQLEEIYNNSCSLRFINMADCRTIVPQCAENVEIIIS